MSEVSGGDWLLVLLRTDSKGTVTVLCKGLEQDTMFPEKVMLKGILGFFWALGAHHVQVKVWSVPKDTVITWKMGTLMEGAAATMASLTGEVKETPMLPGTEPNMNVVAPSEMDTLFENLKAQSKKLTEQNKQPPAALPVEDPPDPPQEVAEVGEAEVSPTLAPSTKSSSKGRGRGHRK